MLAVVDVVLNDPLLVGKEAQLAKISPAEISIVPVKALFRELTRLHRLAGEPSSRTIARAVALSHATVHAALRGPKVPRWDVLDLVIEQLGGDKNEVLRLWVAARDAEDHHRRFPSVPNSGPTTTVSGRAAKVSEQEPLTVDRLQHSLTRLDIRFTIDPDSSALLANWDRHAMLFALEGPSDEILVQRCRPHMTATIRRRKRAYDVVNEWNHTRRFMKAYVGDVNERGELPIYAEMQVPAQSGVHNALLDELVDTATSVAASFSDWLYDEVKVLPWSTK